MSLTAEHYQSAHKGQRTFSDEEVREIRLSLESNPVCARRLGVSTELVRCCRNGKTYGRLLPDEELAQEARLGEFDQVGENSFQALEAFRVGAAFPVRGRPDLAERFDRIDALDAVHECPHGRLAGDRTPPCGCWPTLEGFGVIEGDGEPQPARRVA